MASFILAPSILSADFAKLGEDVSKVLVAGADMIHFDVMDNHFVPNLSFGACVCKALRNYGITAPIDAHLMVSPCSRLIDDFIEAGASYITVHVEGNLHLDKSLQQIKSAGLKAGVALNPATPLSSIEYVLDKLDLICCMSVNPGFGGQTFIESSLNKIRQVKEMIVSANLPILLEVDGGVNVQNIAQIAKAGANTFVAGSAIFGAKNYAKAISDMRKQLVSIL